MLTETKVCPGCGQTFSPAGSYPSVWRDRVFCGRSCAGKSAVKMIGLDSLRPVKKTLRSLDDTAPERKDTRTPTSAYARCDECGTDAGEPCYDSQDRPCAPHAGRVLSGGIDDDDSDDSDDKEAPPPPPPKIKAPRCKCGRQRQGGDTCGRRQCRPAVSCWWCRAAVDIVGRPPDARRPCCGDLPCRRAISRERAKESRKPPDPASQRHEK